jgi:hypothetical protein
VDNSGQTLKEKLGTSDAEGYSAKRWSRRAAVSPDAAEAEALAGGDAPEKMRQRLAAHVAFIMSSKVKAVDLTLREERLSGSFLLENGERRAALGLVAARDGKVRRFELIVKGRTSSESATGFPSPGGRLADGKKATAAVAFMLADPKDELAKVQPASSRGRKKGSSHFRSWRSEGVLFH